MCFLLCHYFNENKLQILGGKNMGFFSEMSKLSKQGKVTDIAEMEFTRPKGFSGQGFLAFEEEGMPNCPMCQKFHPWLTHVAMLNKGTMILPKQDLIYHIKCDGCGFIMHTTHHKIGTNTDLPRFMSNPSKKDNVTVMTVDVVGDKATDLSMAGKEFTVAELNEMIK